MLNADTILLIFGAINANTEDREIKRTELSTLQYLDEGLKVNQTDFFQTWGELGLSSMVFLPGQSSRYFITTGAALFLIDHDESQSIKRVVIPKLRGVHEMWIVGEVLWISNTYYDEVIAYDYLKDLVLQRLKLTPDQVHRLDERLIDPNDEIRENRFHCNQIFEAFDGDICLLVHHINGEQLIKRVAQKMIKSQGNGGIINVSSGDRLKLQLKAPHSVRKVEENYWIFDSGHKELTIFDQNWRLNSLIPVGGWGRGGDYLAENRLFFAGISAPRRRYLKAFDSEEKTNKLLAISTEQKKVVREWELSGLEQVNNVYLVKKDFLAGLERLQQIIESHAHQ